MLEPSHVADSRDCDHAGPQCTEDLVASWPKPIELQMQVPQINHLLLCPFHEQSCRLVTGIARPALGFLESD